MPRIGVDPKKLAAAFDDIQASGYLAEGKYTRLFERSVQAWSGCRAAAVANCGSGLFAVLRQIKKRSGIAVVPVNTFFATGAMAKEAGFTVVGADCSKTDFSLTAEMLDRYAPALPDVVVLTHVGGGLALDYRGVADWCRKRGVFLLEDAAHALGTIGSNGIQAGSLGDAAVFSLYATKAVPVGEGGVVISKDDGLIEDVQRFVNYGKFYQDGKLRYTGEGFNLRMWEWMAAVSYLQMERLDEILDMRDACADKLSRICPPMVNWPHTNWYKYIVSASFPAKKVAGQVYGPADQLTASLGVAGRYPNAQWVGANHKCLPIEEGLYEGMTTAQIERFLMGKDNAGS
jgi:dTDP-4-amino-4,6-dideoxygalactose transaminase